MPGPASFSKDFPLDVGIFTAAKLTVGASTDANALASIVQNDKFPDGNIELGHISLTADTGAVALNPQAVGGAAVSFDIGASAESGVGVYGQAADALAALKLTDLPPSVIGDGNGQRYLLMDWRYSASLSGSASHPIGVVGSVSFGVDAERASLFAIVHRFDANQGAHFVLEDAIASWRLPRQVAFDGRDVNLKPGTWLLAEADGSLAFTLAANLGWNVTFAKDATLLGVTHNLSARIDAGLTTSLGFRVSGRYLVAVGREGAGPVVRLRLFKQSSKGLDFGFNLTVGAQGSDPQLPTRSDDLVQSVFGVHALQVLNDVRDWSDASTDLGAKLAGLGDDTATDLVKRSTGVDPAVEFEKGRQILAHALATWDSLPDRLQAMLLSFLGRRDRDRVQADLTVFLADLQDPARAAKALADALQRATFGDTPQGQFLDAIADRGLLALLSHPGPVMNVAAKVLDILNGGVIAKLVAFIDEKLHLDQIRKAVNDTDFGKVDQWLQARLAVFLDKTLRLDDLKDVQKGIRTIDTKVTDYYKAGVEALTRRYAADFAATYQTAAADTALLDVGFDLSVAAAASAFAAIVGKGSLDDFLTRDTPGVTLHQATLTHDITRTGVVNLHMPFFDFTRTHVNDAMVSLTVEEDGGRVLVYQIDAKDTVTVANRASSQLAVLASLTTADRQRPQLDESGSIAYEMRQVKSDMRPADLEARTSTFVHQYLGNLFRDGDDPSIRGFYTDLDNALTAATHNRSNHLGDMAVSMQVALPATVLLGWFRLRDAGLLHADQLQLSRALQSAWKKLLPALYFRTLSQYQTGENVAALLVWASLPVSTSVDFANGQIVQMNNDGHVFWDWRDVNLRRAMTRDPLTIASLARRLTDIHAQLVASGDGNAGAFDPMRAGAFVNVALADLGDNFLRSLLVTEEDLVAGATDALADVSSALGTVTNAPTRAIKTLAKFAAELTDTFNDRVSSIYSGIAGRVIGPMLLVEASRALASPGLKPDAMLTLYALNPGHAYKLDTFLDGKRPPQGDVALTQTLVSAGRAQ
jgi:hypothetical protein